MVFDSVTFWLFVLPVLVAWWMAPFGAAKILALIASCVFYAWWNPLYLLLIVGSALIDYGAAGQIARSSVPRKRKFWVTVSLASNLGLLAGFKYTPLVARD
ncbi:MAG TPA: MBOAT family protein, partial [Planctomycetota bacterium]|nr:MBOAT family protein [Planctomycetota bacterium]